MTKKLSGGIGPPYWPAAPVGLWYLAGERAMESNTIAVLSQYKFEGNVKVTKSLHLCHYCLDRFFNDDEPVGAEHMATRTTRIFGNPPQQFSSRQSRVEDIEQFIQIINYQVPTFTQEKVATALTKLLLKFLRKCTA